MSVEMITVSGETIFAISILVVAGIWLLWDASKCKPGVCISCSKETWVRKYHNEEGIQADVCDKAICQHEAWLAGFS
jgi:hypothetical protein